MSIQIKHSGAIAALLLCWQTAGATELWNNGEVDDVSYLGDSQYSTSVADDFYVSGVGWRVTSLHTRGFFLNNSTNVTAVEVTIFPHDNSTGMPNTDAPLEIEVSSFDAEPTGEIACGYQEVALSINLPDIYLQGGRYFWIAIEAFDQNSQAHFHFRASEDQLNHPAQLISNSMSHPYGGNLDMAYSLSGIAFKSIHKGLLGSAEFAQKSTETGSVALYVGADEKQVNRHLRPGLYTIGTQRGRPQAFRVDRYGSTRVQFDTGSSDGTQRLHSPLGDDMCSKAESSFHEFCQSFVACAAYDFGCY